VDAGIVVDEAVSEAFVSFGKGAERDPVMLFGLGAKPLRFVKCPNVDEQGR
jgi:hypothetical protein